MNKSAVQYRKRLAKNLQCSGRTRKDLLDSFDRSLENYLQEHPESTAQALQAAFGPPSEMAWVLMEGINDEEIARFRLQQIIKQIAAGLFMALLVVLAVYGFVR